MHLIGHGAERPADIGVFLLIEVRQRDPARRLKRAKPAPRQQDNACVVGYPEQELGRRDAAPPSWNLPNRILPMA